MKKILSRRNFLKKTTIMGTALFHSGITKKLPAAKKDRPNVIFIMTDDQIPETIGYFGGRVLTPNIDSLAKEGMVFNQAYVSTTVCAPARYTTLTGRYSGRCRSDEFLKIYPLNKPLRVENLCDLEKDGMNLPSVLQKAGYKTGIVGKWHLSGYWNREYQKRYGLEFYDQKADPNDPEVKIKMKSNHKKLRELVKTYGFDYANSLYGANLLELYNDALNYHNLDWTVKGALEFLDKYRNDPFFLYFSTTLHHGPEPRHSLSKSRKLTGEGVLDEEPNVLPSYESIKQRVREKRIHPRNEYCTWLDDGVGAILDKIKKLGLDNNTLIIYASDHGKKRFGKSTLYQGGVHIPLIMRWKNKIKPGSICDELVQNIDYTPTLLDVANVNPPDNMHMDGKSIFPLMKGEKKEIHKSLFGEIGYARAVITKKWKYISVRYPEDVLKKIARGEKFPNWVDEDLYKPYYINNAHLGYHSFKKNPNYFLEDQLYNLIQDPEENNNLAEKYPEKLQEMQKMLKEYLITFNKRPYGEFVK